MPARHVPALADKDSASTNTVLMAAPGLRNGKTGMRRDARNVGCTGPRQAVALCFRVGVRGDLRLPNGRYAKRM